MNRSRLWFGGLLPSLAVLLTTVQVRALEPPTPEQIAQYQADGTLEKRIARAKELGNDRVAPDLALGMRQRLNGARLRALGASEAELSEQAANAPAVLSSVRMPSTGTVKVLVLLVDFPDCPHGSSPTVESVGTSMFGDGDPTLYPYESLHNYYDRSSYHQLDIQGNVLGWYTASHNRSYYETAGREALIMEAMNYYDDPANGGHDFTQYDSDNDGKIDAVYIYWTGSADGWADFWWPCVGWGFPDYVVDGKRVVCFCWSCAFCFEGGTKTDIHETGHLLGLPDLYDYSSMGGGPCMGSSAGGCDMMDRNKGDHNCYSKYLLGWLNPPPCTSSEWPRVISDGSQTVALRPSGDYPDCVLAMPGAMSGLIPDEFFMVQYRKQGVGNDPPAVSNPGDVSTTDGYMIWHIDSDGYMTGHKTLQLMQADGLEEIEHCGRAHAGDFYRPPSVFGVASRPNSSDYSGHPTGVQVDHLTTPGETMGARFSIIGPWFSAVGAGVTSGACGSSGGAIESGQTITANLTLRNVGVGPTTNLVATLLPTGGVVSPSSPQTYGSLAPGHTASRPFSFSVGRACGGTVTATLQLEDGTNVLDPVTFSFQVGSPNLSLIEGFDLAPLGLLPPGWSSVVASGNSAGWQTVTGGCRSPQACYCDCSTPSDVRLDSPVIAAGTWPEELTFRHSYTGSPDGTDGRVLEIAIGNGDFIDILQAGGHFIDGGYDSIASIPSLSPNSERWAWTGSPDVFTTTVRLPATVAENSYRLRWRLLSSHDQLTHWAIDDVSITSGYSCCASAPRLIEARSLKQHGTCGEYGIPLPLAGTSGVECRDGGPTKVVFTFSEDIQVDDGMPDGTEVSMSAGTLTGVSVSGSQLLVTFGGVPDQTCVTITLSGISNLLGRSLVGDRDVQILNLKGDVNGDGVVDLQDLAVVQSDSGVACDSTKCRSDVNASGLVDGDDASQIVTGRVASCSVEPDCNHNQVRDDYDISLGTSRDFNENAIPDECEDCNANGQPDVDDIATGVSADVDGDGIPDECEQDCNHNGIPDHHELACAYFDQDKDRDDVPDECEPDCNNNQYPDDYDLANGISQDVNNDGVPDECEPNCNNNQYPDDYDLSHGISQDVNADGIPDECQPNCNNNQYPDDYDIAHGISQDIDHDGKPDECEPDCNLNGIPDDDDVLTNRSQDCDGNGVLNECEPATWTPLGSGVDSVVCALAGYSGELVAAGTFTHTGADTVNRVARWNPTTSTWSSLTGPAGTGVNNVVFALTTYSGQLIAGGGFTTAGGVTASRVAQWNGTAWSPLAGPSANGVNGVVYALTTYNSQLIAGGTFPTAGGVSASRIALWNGTAWSSLGSGMAGASPCVYALAVYHNTQTDQDELIAGGFFTSAGGVAASNIAGWNGTSWYALGSGSSAAVRALTVHNGVLIAGGSFPVQGGTTASVAAWDGSSWQPLVGGVTTPSTIYALASIADGPDQGLYAGVSGPPGVLRWRDNQWSSMGGTYAVRAIAVGPDSAVHIGGEFTTANCQSAAHVARWTDIPEPRPTLVSASSVKQHGSRGEYSIDLPLTGTPGVECRNGGPTTVVFTFSEPIQTTENIAPVTVSVGTVDDISVTGSQLTATLSGVSDETCLTVSVWGIVDASGLPLIGGNQVEMIALKGDVNGDGQVDLRDVDEVKSHVSNLTWNPAYFRDDVDLTGLVNVTDVSQTRAGVGNVTPCTINPGPRLYSAVSRKTHGTAGDYDIELPVDNNAAPGVECRNGPLHLVVRFSEPVQAIGSPLVTLSAGTATTSISTEGDLIIDSSDVPDQTCLSVTLAASNLADINGHALQGDNDIGVICLRADVNGDGHVDIRDVDEVKSHSSMTWHPENFRSDLDHSGMVGSSDIVLVRALEGNAAPCTTDPGPWLYSAVSRKMLGQTPYDLALPFDSSAGSAVECRSGGPTELVLKFSEPVKAIDGTFNTEVQVSAGSVVSIAPVGSDTSDTLDVQVSGVPDGTCLVVSLVGLADLHDHELTGTSSFLVRVLYGDVDFDGVVSQADVDLVTAAQGQSLSTSNFWKDVDGSGAIDSTDTAGVSQRMGNSVTCP